MSSKKIQELCTEHLGTLVSVIEPYSPTVSTNRDSIIAVGHVVGTALEIADTGTFNQENPIIRGVLLLNLI